MLQSQALNHHYQPSASVIAIDPKATGELHAANAALFSVLATCNTHTTTLAIKTII